MANNIFGIILAGGQGTRMGNAERPKQFMEIGRKPIIVHTIEKFVIHSAFDRIIVLSPKAWISHTKDLIRKYIPDHSDIIVIPGGSTRNETIMNAIRYIEENFGLDDDTIIVTHDSVRPFVSHRMIEENIQAAVEYGACDTVIPASDTIVESQDHKFISSIPDRSAMYQGQTPQSFRAKNSGIFMRVFLPQKKKFSRMPAKSLFLKEKRSILWKAMLQISKSHILPTSAWLKLSWEGNKC